MRTVAAGSWPVWNPSVAFGQPLLADANNQVLYPLTWLHPILAPWTYHALLVTGHLFFSGAGLYLLARRLGVSAAGGFVAACLWATSGPLLSLVYVANHYCGAAWIPWVLLAAERALASRRAGDALLWGAAMAAQVLAGSPDMCAMSQLLAAAQALRRVAWRRPLDPGNRRILASAALAWSFALTLSAAQWLPSLEVARQSARRDLPTVARTYWSVHPWILLQTVLPVFPNQLPLEPRHRAALYESRDPFLDSLYLGAFGLVAAAFVPPRRPHRRFLALVAAGAAAVALGRHAAAYGTIVTLVPPLRMLRYPVKATIVAAVGWSLLAGMGLDAWRSLEPVRRRRWLLWVILPLAGLAVIAGAGAFLAAFAPDVLGSRVLQEVPGLSARQVLAPVARRLAIAAALCSASAALAWRRRPWTAPAAALLAILDLSATHRNVNPAGPREIVTLRPAALQKVRAGDHRRLYVYDYLVGDKSRRYLHRDNPYVIAWLPTGWSPAEATALAMRTYLFPPSGGGWGLENSYDVDILQIAPAYLRDLTDLLHSVEGTKAHLRLLRVGAVGHVVALHAEGLEDLEPVADLPSLFPERIRVYRVPEPLPRCYAVGGVRVADADQALALLTHGGFDPRREVILPEGRPVAADPAFRADVRILEMRPDRARLEARLSSPGYVVLVDGYDPAWGAEVDGDAVAVMRANVGFRAVAVPAGRHVVELAYRPRSAMLGLAVSVVALAAGLFGALRLRGSRS